MWELQQCPVMSIYMSLSIFFNSANKFFEVKAKALGDFRMLGVIPSMNIWQIAKGIPSVLLQVFSFYILFTWWRWFRFFLIPFAFWWFSANWWYSIFHSLLERLHLLGVCLLLMYVRQLQNKLKRIHYTQQIHSQTHFTLVCLFSVQPIASRSLFKDHDWGQRWKKVYFDFNLFHWQLWERHFVIGGIFSYHQNELYASKKSMFVALCTEVDRGKRWSPDKKKQITML